MAKPGEPGYQESLGDDAEVFVIDTTGARAVIPRSSLGEALARGYKLESHEATQEAGLEREYGDSGGQAFLEGAARGVTLGLSDAVIGQLDEEGFRERRERNTGAALAGEVGGSLLPFGAGGLAAGAGRAAEAGIAGSGVVRAAAGGGRLSRALAGAAPVIARGAAEGAVIGAGSGVSQVALSEDPVTVEGALTTIGTSALFGGTIGGGAGAAGALLSGAAKAGRAYAGRKLELLTGGADNAAARAESGAARSMAPAAEGEALEQVAKMDRAGIRAAEKVEKARVQTWAREEASKVFDEAKVFSAQAKGTFLATESPELAVRLGKSRGAIMRSLDDPKGFVESPWATAKALRKQESAVEEVLAAGKLSERGTAEAEKLLASNQALQGRLKSVTDLYKTPASQMLDALAARTDELAGGGAAKGLAQKVVEQIGGGLAAKAAFSTGVGAFLAPAAYELGKDAAGALFKGTLAGALSKGAAGVAKRVEGALDAFAKVGARAQRAAPVLATKTLERITYAPKDRASPRAYVATKSALAAATRARIDELAAQVEPDPTRPGKLRLNGTAAADLHERLAGLWVTHPKFADELEGAAARRITYLAEHAPKRPAAGAMPIGPDRWQPSDMDARKFGRIADAVEDPGAIVERLSDGTLTPEDADVLRNVYPGIFAQVRNGLFDRLTELRSSLPYERRLTLSILFKVPVDESMSPAMVTALQSSFTAPTPSQQMPGAGGGAGNMGALKAPEPTRAQKTAG